MKINKEEMKSKAKRKAKKKEPEMTLEPDIMLGFSINEVESELVDIKNTLKDFNYIIHESIKKIRIDLRDVKRFAKQLKNMKERE